MASNDGPRQAHSRRAFADERTYRAQRSVYEGSSGPDAREVLWNVIAQRPLGDLLDVGCGEGEFAAQARAAGWYVLAVDSSARMVNLTAARGVCSSVQDVRRLALADETFDCVVAGWLFHYLDEWEIKAALAEIRRVLRPNGVLATATQSQHHMAELWSRLPDVSYRIPFAGEVAEQVLGEQFADVCRRDVEGTVVFRDFDQAHTFVANQVRPASLADRLRPFDGPLRVTRRSIVLSAVRR
jgi:SAM-dependent methyltransferase